MLEEMLKNKNCFKLVLGAGNENIVQIAKLISFYYGLGCRFFDLGANPSIIEMGQKLAPQACFCASFVVTGDTHISKVIIDDNKCTKCGRCYSVCPQDALHKNFKNCIGCKMCEHVCPNNAISFYEPKKNFEENFEKIVNLGVECIELHANTPNQDEIFQKWNFISKNYNGILSVCTGANDLELVKKLIETRKPYTTIIQADGKAMSGINDELETTMKAVECAKIYSEAKLPSYLLVSGGTNSKTYALLKKNKVDFAGIAYGTYARHLTDEKSALEILKPLTKPMVTVMK